MKSSENENYRVKIITMANKTVTFFLVIKEISSYNIALSCDVSFNVRIQELFLSVELIEEER